jgi:hypothetical protein
MCVETPDGIVRMTTSHSIDATRYIVAKSEDFRDRCCSRSRSRLRPRAASREASSEATKLVSSSTDEIKSFVKYENRIIESKIPRAYGSYWHHASGSRRIRGEGYKPLLTHLASLMQS